MVSIRGLDTRDPYAPSPDERRRAVAMARAWDAYHGQFHGGNPQWPLLWNTGKEPNPNVIINRCGPAADADVSWLFGESVAITLKKAPRAAQEYVDQVWGVASDDSSDDDKMTLLQEMATNGAVTGHAFLKIVWDEETMEYPELVVLDSTQVRVICDPHNIKLATCYIVEYAVPDPNGQSNGPAGAGIAMFRQVTELVDPDDDHTEVVSYGGSLAGDDDATWRITEYLKPANSQVYQQIGEPKEWPFSWSPIQGCAHLVNPNQYYGRPRLSGDVIHVNEAICMTASNINKIAMRHGHPILYTIKTGANQRTLRHEPGTIMEVASDVKAVEAYGDLAHLMQFEEDLRADFDEETHVPAQVFGRQQDISRTPVSGVAIRLGYGSLMADITKERRTYGALIRKVTQYLLELKDPAWADTVVTIGWQDPLPADDLQQAQVIQAYLTSGIMSKASAADKAGLDWGVEQEQLKEEAQTTMLNMYHGQGLPPAPPPAGGGGEPPPSGRGQQNGQPGSSDGNPGVNPTHPAAVAAQQRASAVMKAAFGKTGTARKTGKTGKTGTARNNA